DSRNPVCLNGLSDGESGRGAARICHGGRLRLFAGHPAKVTLGSNNKMSSLVIVANLSAAIETARIQILAARSCDRGDAGGGKITGRPKNGRCICRCAAPISSNEPADIKPV